MNRLIIIVFVLLGFNSSIFGQEQRYLSQKYSNLNSLGYTYSEYDTISNRLYPGFYKIYSQAVNKTFGEDIKEVKYLNEFVRFESIDTTEIKSLCKQNNLDAILMTKVYFLSRYFIYKDFLSLEKIYHPHFFQHGPYCFYVELEIFDRHGKLILNSSAITSDGYNANKSLTNGFEKALKKAKKKR